MSPDTERAAAAYARATTNARCAHMGACKGCTIRYCDYKSRYEAWLQGHEAAASEIFNRINSDMEKAVQSINDKAHLLLADLLTKP